MAEAKIVKILDSWPEQETRGHSIPGYRYTSAEFFHKEWEGMWTKTWLLLGREAQLPNPKDWQMEPVGPEEILMVRQDDMSVKAFYNVCQHRGNPLVSEARGHVRSRFVCKYHSWAFTPDGELNFAPDKDDFPQGNPCGKLRLEEIPCETFAGFIWINMDPNAKPLKEYLGPIWDEWEAREVHTWKRTMANSMWLPCNWKVVLDNFNESYHVPTVHMGATPNTDRKKIKSNIQTYYKETQFDLSNEGHNRMVMKGGYGSGQTDAEGNISNPLRSVLEYWDIDPADYRGRPEDTREALQEAKQNLGPGRGYTHYANVPPEQLTDAFHYTLFPNFAVSLWADGFHFLRARPHPTDPAQCLFDNWWYASPASLDTPLTNRSASAMEGSLANANPDTGEVDVTLLSHPEDSIGPAIEEDVAVFVTQQRGFGSRGYKGAYLAEQEKRISRYHELIDDYIEANTP